MIWAFILERYCNLDAIWVRFFVVAFGFFIRISRAPTFRLSSHCTDLKRVIPMGTEWIILCCCFSFAFWRAFHFNTHTHTFPFELHNFRNRDSRRCNLLVEQSSFLGKCNATTKCGCCCCRCREFNVRRKTVWMPNDGVCVCACYLCQSVHVNCVFESLANLLAGCEHQ